MAASLCETLDGGDGVSSHVWQRRQVCSPGTEDGQGLWEEEGRGNSAGLKGRGEEMHHALKRGSSPSSGSYLQEGTSWAKMELWKPCGSFRRG